MLTSRVLQYVKDDAFHDVSVTLQTFPVSSLVIKHRFQISEPAFHSLYLSLRSHNSKLFESIINLHHPTRKMKISAAFVCLLSAQPVAALMGATSKTASQTALFGLPPKTGDNKELQNIFYQNQAWKAEKMAEDPEFFDKLGTTHTPEFMWIGT